jgi:hypothetical protein
MIGMALATVVSVTGDTLIVDLAGGGKVSAPLAWYPRLLHATPDERSNWKLVALGEGIYWPDVEEDISVASLIAGRPSAESAASLQTWMNKRKA